MRSQIILMFLLVVGCSGSDRSTARIYLSNHALQDFDKSMFNVLVDDKLIYSDSINNKYLSFHWRDSLIGVPKNDFKLTVDVTTNGYQLKRDTVVSYSDSLEFFITFNFKPYYKRYRNPEIYKYLPSETARLKEIADSLYSNGILSNASRYLNDTIPTKDNIEIVVK